MAAQQDVGGLQVAVQDAALVSVMDGAGHGRHQPRGGTRVVGVALDLGGQVAAVDEFHAEVVVAVVLADLVDRHDMRMIEVRGRFGLAGGSARRSPGVANRPAPTILTRQHAVQAHLPGLVDDPHSALREDLDQLVIAEIADTRRVEISDRVCASASMRPIRETESSAARSPRIARRSVGLDRSIGGAVSSATWSWLAKKSASSAASSGYCFKQGVAIRGLAGLASLEIIGDDLIEPLLSIAGMARGSSRMNLRECSPCRHLG